MQTAGGLTPSAEPPRPPAHRPLVVVRGVPLWACGLWLWPCAPCLACWGLAGCGDGWRRVALMLASTLCSSTAPLYSLVHHRLTAAALDA